MNRYTYRIIMAVENEVLRDTLLSALAPLECSPEVLTPYTLLQTQLSGVAIIFLETSNDVERLIHTAQQLKAKWDDPERAFMLVFSYSRPDVTFNDVRVRLRRLRPNPEVLVQTWHYDTLSETAMKAYSSMSRLVQAQAKNAE